MAKNVETRSRKLKHYLTADGQDPFGTWIKNLRDKQGQGRIRVRLNRVIAGNFGDHRPVGEGVQELVFDFGPGYRIYYGEDGDDVILLEGGDKSNQSADILNARERWRDYNA
jgi:putative addiction module killer protein